MYEVRGGVAANTATAREALRLILWAVLFGAILMLAACGGSDEAPPAPPPAPTEVSASIGTAGGTLAGPDGVSVVIPPNALTANTVIKIARSSAGAPAMPTENPPAGAVYEFTPHGLVFNAPVTIRMPVPANAVGSEVFMASPGEGWEVNGATVIGGIAQWERNSFSWGLMGVACALPANNTDPYPCTYPSGAAVATAVPASALTRSAFGNSSSNAGSWVVNSAGIVSLTLNYRAAPDCGNPRIKLLRWNPAVSPRVVQTLLDVPVSLTLSPVTVPPGTLSSDTGGPSFRGVGTTTVDVSANLTDAVNAFGFSFSCARPGRASSGGGDLITIRGPMPAPVGPFRVGGTVSGLTGTGLVLQNNGGDNLTVPANATTFNFASLVANGAAYSVSVLSQPSGQVCTVQSGSGTATANVSNVAVSCTGTGPVPLAATAMAVGYANSLVVATDGTVWAWGYQIDPVTGGYKSASPWATTPVQVQGLSGVKAVALSAEAGSFYALHTDGTVSAWGLNSAGQLGDRTTTTRPLPVKVMQDATTPMDEVCSIAASSNILFMARASGCSPGQRSINYGPWIVGLFSGQNFGGDSAAGFPTNGAIAKLAAGWPVGQTAGETASFMSAPDSATSGSAVFIRTGRGDQFVWGSNGGNRLGVGVSVAFAGSAAGPVPAPGLFWSGIGNVQFGRDLAVAMDETSSLVAVGRNLEGQLGNGGTSSSSSLVAVSLSANVSAFSVGQVSAAAITGGALWAWGWNGSSAVTVPARVGTGTGFTQVAVGDIHSLAIGPGGEVYSWGDSSFGALGRTGGASIPAVVMRP